MADETEYEHVDEEAEAQTRKASWMPGTSYQEENEPNVDLHALQEEVEILREQNARLQQRPHAYSLSVSTPQLFMTTILALTIFLCLPMGTVANFAYLPGPSELYLCPKWAGTTFWRLPETVNCQSQLNNLLHLSGQVVPNTIQLYNSPSTYDKVNTSMCVCTRTTHSFLKDLGGRRKYYKQTHKLLKVSESVCHRMLLKHESPAGALIEQLNGWGTNNSIEFPWLPRPFGCCHWHHHAVDNCYIQSINITVRDPGRLESTAITLPPGCNLKDGFCSSESGEYLVWRPTEPYTTPLCYYPGIKKDGYKVDTKEGVYWVSVDGTIFMRVQPPIQGAPELDIYHLCKGGNVTLVTGEVGRNMLHFSEIAETPSLRTPTYQAVVLLSTMACKSIEQKVESLRQEMQINAILAARKLTQRNNVTASLDGDVIQFRSCYTIPKESFYIGESHINSQLEQRFKVQFQLAEQSHIGYVNLHTNIITPTAFDSPRQVLPRTLLTEMATDINEAMRIVYSIKLFGQLGTDWQPDPATTMPQYMWDTWMREPPAGYSVILTMTLVQEVNQYMGQLIPLNSHLPFGAQHLWFLLIALYVTLVIIAIHCCPSWYFLKYLNPVRYCWQKTARPWKTRNRLHSPRFQRRLREYQTLLNNPTPNVALTERHQISWRSNHRDTPLTLIDTENPNPFSQRMQVYNVHHPHSQGTLTATIKVKIQGKSFTALLDTGSNVSLLKENVANNLGLEVTQDNNSQATSISGHDFPLKGLVFPQVHIGKRLLSKHQMYVAPGIPYDVLIGFQALEQMGPVLLDYKNGQMHLYAKPPRAAADIVALGKNGLPGEEEEWKVSLTEDLILEPRTRTAIMAGCEHAPENAECMLLPSEKLAKDKNIAIAHCLVTPK